MIHQEDDSFIRIKISSLLSEYRKIPKFDIQVSIHKLITEEEMLICHLTSLTDRC